MENQEKKTGEPRSEKAVDQGYAQPLFVFSSFAPGKIGFSGTIKKIIKWGLALAIIFAFVCPSVINLIQEKEKLQVLAQNSQIPICPKAEDAYLSPKQEKAELRLDQNCWSGWVTTMAFNKWEYYYDGDDVLKIWFFDDWNQSKPPLAVSSGEHPYFRQAGIFRFRGKGVITIRGIK